LKENRKDVNWNSLCNKIIFKHNCSINCLWGLYCCWCTSCSVDEICILKRKTGIEQKKPQKPSETQKPKFDFKQKHKNHVILKFDCRILPEETTNCKNAINPNRLCQRNQIQYLHSNKTLNRIWNWKCKGSGNDRWTNP